MGLILEKEDAILAWRALAGPTNSEKAKTEAPNRFGPKLPSIFSYFVLFF